jgi:hypothetical protein
MVFVFESRGSRLCRHGAHVDEPPPMAVEVWVVVAKYVMVDENLPHDRRNYQVLVSIMRQ